jgi:hypothetical protein
MAANQTSNQRNKSSNHKTHAGQPIRRPESENEESSGAFAAVGDMAGQASDYISESASEMQECIRERSGTAVAISLVAGFGIGLLVGRALTKSEPEPRSRRYRAAAEGVGRRLMDRIEAMIPDALAEHFGK